MPVRSMLAALLALVGQRRTRRSGRGVLRQTSGDDRCRNGYGRHIRSLRQDDRASHREIYPRFAESGRPEYARRRGLSRRHARP